MPASSSLLASLADGSCPACLPGLCVPAAPVLVCRCLPADARQGGPGAQQGHLEHLLGQECGRSLGVAGGRLGPWLARGRNWDWCLLGSRQWDSPSRGLGAFPAEPVQDLVPPPQPQGLSCPSVPLRASVVWGSRVVSLPHSSLPPQGECLWVPLGQPQFLKALSAPPAPQGALRGEEGKGECKPSETPGGGGGAEPLP